MALCSRGYKKVAHGLGGGKKQFSSLQKLYFQEFLKNPYVLHVRVLQMANGLGFNSNKLSYTSYQYTNSRDWIIGFPYINANPS